MLWGLVHRALMPWALKYSALYISHPGMAEAWSTGTPHTAASVEERPPGLVMNRSAARMYAAI